jgi:hypothetical protein
MNKQYAIIKLNFPKKQRTRMNLYMFFIFLVFLFGDSIMATKVVLSNMFEINFINVLLIFIIPVPLILLVMYKIQDRIYSFKVEDIFEVYNEYFKYNESKNIIKYNEILQIEIYQFIPGKGSFSEPKGVKIAIILKNRDIYEFNIAMRQYDGKNFMKKKQDVDLIEVFKILKIRYIYYSKFRNKY